MESGYPMLNKTKIVVTGGTGRFGQILKKKVGKTLYFQKKSIKHT